MKDLEQSNRKIQEKINSNGEKNINIKSFENKREKGEI